MSLNPIVYRPIQQWPGELTPDHARRQSQFSAEFRQTLRLLSEEVDHLAYRDQQGETLIVVQLAVTEREVRKDETGLLTHAKPQHPGVIVSFDAKAGPLRFSCDRHDNRYHSGGAGWRHNLRAIALGLQALRAVDRYGLGTGREQYTGFGALPPATPMGAAMTVEEAARLLSVDPIDSDEDFIRGRYRTLAKDAHPDHGGDAALFQRLTAARDLLLENLR